MYEQRGLAKSADWEHQMGLEAICDCRVGERSAQAKALLETHELIFRAPIKQTFNRSELTDIKVAGEELQLRAGGTAIALRLGAATAEKWAKKITSPPPNLGQKLGIGRATLAFVIGEVADPALLDALDGHTAAADAASLSLAVVEDLSQLDSALDAHRSLPSGAPIWVIYNKGPRAGFGEAAVRQRMRSLGFKDTKVSAVSGTLSATRYSPP